MTTGENNQKCPKGCGPNVLNECVPLEQLVTTADIKETTKSSATQGDSIARRITTNPKRLPVDPGVAVVTSHGFSFGTDSTQTALDSIAIIAQQDKNITLAELLKKR